jgi:hypothetical protein
VVCSHNSSEAFLIATLDSPDLAAHILTNVWRFLPVDGVKLLKPPFYSPAPFTLDGGCSGTIVPYFIASFSLKDHSGVQSQATRTAVGGVDAAPLEAVVVAHRATQSARAHFDAMREPARYHNFQFAVHSHAL